MKISDGLNEVITFAPPVELPKMQPGEVRDITLKSMVTIEDIVMPFSKDVPKGVAWKDWDSLPDADRELVNELVPDTRKGGELKSKFAHKILLNFEDVENGKKYYYIGETKTEHRKFATSDIAFYVNEDNTPWSNFQKFLDLTGGSLTIGTVYQGALMADKDGYLHLDPATVLPKINM